MLLIILVKSANFNLMLELARVKEEDVPCLSFDTDAVEVNILKDLTMQGKGADETFSWHEPGYFSLRGCYMPAYGESRVTLLAGTLLKADEIRDRLVLR